MIFIIAAFNKYIEQAFYRRFLQIQMINVLPILPNIKQVDIQYLIKINLKHW